jgi:CyaY protein
MTTVSANQAVHPLTDARYHELTRDALGRIEACVDRWLDDDVIDIDTHRTGGLLELALPDHSKIIINTQPPLHELWLAARAGGFHFRFDGAHWVDTRTGQEFFALLSEQLSAQSGQSLRVLAA